MKQIINRIILAAMIIVAGYFIFNKLFKKEFFKSKDIPVDIYLVAFGGSNVKGKIIGCDDILVPLTKKVTVETSDLEAALNELFAQKDTPELHTFIKGPGLMLLQVLIADGKAEVYLKGDFEITRKCDIDHIKEQIYETAKQFTEYREIQFYIGNQTLDRYLSVAGIGL